VRGAESWTLRKIYQKYLESFKMWCWRRMAKISWIDCVKFKYYKELRMVRLISHFLCKNCILKYVIKGKIEKIKNGREDEEEDISNYWMTLRK
jgi:hypothetical protein